MENNYREECLNLAKQIVVQGERYGKQEDSFGMIAKLWSAYLGIEVKEHDVCMLMCLLKIARVKSFPEHLDSIVDICGYSANSYDSIKRKIKSVNWEAN